MTETGRLPTGANTRQDEPMNRVAVQPDLLRWARERSGHGADTLAGRFPTLEAWELGEDLSTLAQIGAFPMSPRVELPILVEETPRPGTPGLLERKIDIRGRPLNRVGLSRGDKSGKVRPVVMPRGGNRSRRLPRPQSVPWTAEPDGTGE